MRLAFSTLAAPGWSIDEVCDAAVAFGYEGLEWRLAEGALVGLQTPDETWGRIAEAMAERGLACACVDTSCVFVGAEHDAAVAEAVGMAAHAAAIGAPAIRVFGGPMRAEPAPEDIGPAREALARAAEGAGRYGVEVLVETHDAWSRALDVAGLVEGVPGLGLLWDVAHTVRAGEDPATSLAACGVPLVVHVKDARGPELTHLGQGEVPLERIVGLLRRAGFDGWLCFEWEKLWHPELAEPEVALPAAADYLRRVVDRS